MAKAKFVIRPLFSTTGGEIAVNGQDLKPYNYSELLSLLPEDIRNLMGESLNPDELKAKTTNDNSKVRINNSKVIQHLALNPSISQVFLLQPIVWSNISTVHSMKSANSMSAKTSTQPAYTLAGWTTSALPRTSSPSDTIDFHRTITS